jgi:heat shock protein HtpX
MRAPPRHRFRNLLHSTLLIAGMAVIGLLCSRVVWGPDAGWWFLGLVAILLVLSPAAPKGLLLSLYKARQIQPREFRAGYTILTDLSERAELPSKPRLFYIPSSLPNAFTLGNRRDSVIAVTDGLLRLMNRREFAGILAHEIAHIVNRDLWIMGLADVISRVTAILSYVGQLILLINLPLIAQGMAHVPWVVPLLLIFSPTILSLLQLALSRTREFEADLTAARLTGDPAGLAAALDKIEHSTGRFWEEIVYPGRRIPDPSLLRTHPPTKQRIKRLLAMRQAMASHDHAGDLPPYPSDKPAITARPRWRRSGVWY